MVLKFKPARAVKVAIVATGTVVVLAGTAYAYWTSTGSGTASATAVTAKPLVMTAVTSPSPAPSLYPGGPAQTLNMTVANPNPYAVALTQIVSGQVTDVKNAAGASVTAAPTPCPTAMGVLPSLLPTATPTPATGTSPQPAPAVTVPAGATAFAVAVPSFLSMNSAAGDGCQGVTFAVHLDVTGNQQ
jgi:hypothetical protein